MKQVFRDGVERDIYMVTIEVYYWQEHSGIGVSYAVEGHYTLQDSAVIESFDNVEDAIEFHRQLEQRLAEEREQRANSLPFPEVVNA